MEEFFTRGIANEGVKLPLYHPDGTVSEHWLKVRGVDSDHFRAADTEGKRKVVVFAALKDPQEKAQAARDTELECIAALVADWSFPQECTAENVVTFLTEAPQIADMVNRFAAHRAEFFSKKSLPSATGSNPKST